MRCTITATADESAPPLSDTTSCQHMITTQRIEVAGQNFVLIEEGEYERLCARAGEFVPLNDGDLPPLPTPDKLGRFPALEFARVSLARDIIRDRRAAGLTQQELADLAKTRQETISRIESGKYTASVKLIDKIDSVLQAALKSRSRRIAKRRARKGSGR